MLKISSATGQITLALLSGVNEISEASPPQLQGAAQPRTGAGIPASKAEVEKSVRAMSSGRLATRDNNKHEPIDREYSRGILNLNQSDFQLFEDGVAQQILQLRPIHPFDLILRSTCQVLPEIR